MIAVILCMRNKMAVFSHHWKAILQLIDWSEQTHHQTRDNQALDHNEKAGNPVTYTYGNHKLTKPDEALFAAETDSNTVENKTLSSSSNVYAKPFVPNYSLHVVMLCA